MINSNIASNIVHCLRCSYSPNILCNVQHNNMLLDDRFALISDGLLDSQYQPHKQPPSLFYMQWGYSFVNVPKCFFRAIISTKFGRKCSGTMNFLLGIKDHPCRLGHKNMILHSSTKEHHVFHYFGPYSIFNHTLYLGLYNCFQ